MWLRKNLLNDHHQRGRRPQKRVDCVSVSAAAGTTPLLPPHTDRKLICPVAFPLPEINNSQTACALNALFALFLFCFSPLVSVFHFSHPFVFFLLLLNILFFLLKTHLFPRCMLSSLFSPLSLTFHPSFPPHHRKHPFSCYCYPQKGQLNWGCVCVACSTLKPPPPIHTHSTYHTYNPETPTCSGCSSAATSLTRNTGSE